MANTKHKIKTNGKEPIERIKQSFPQKHPWLNSVLGLGILLVLILLAYLLIKFVIYKIGALLVWIGDFASHTEATIVVALITGSISIFTVIVGTVVGKYLEQRHATRKYLTEKREKSYCDFVAMVYKVMDKTRGANSYTTEQMTKDILAFSEQISLWGSRAVANKWIEFRLNGMKEKDPKAMLFRLEDIMNCMRKDLGVKKLQQGKLLSFFINDISNKDL